MGGQGPRGARYLQPLSCTMSMIVPKLNCYILTRGKDIDLDVSVDIDANDVDVGCVSSIDASACARANANTNANANPIANAKS